MLILLQGLSDSGFQLFVPLCAASRAVFVAASALLLNVDVNHNNNRCIVETIDWLNKVVDFWDHNHVPVCPIVLSTDPNYSFWLYIKSMDFNHRVSVQETLGRAEEAKTHRIRITSHYAVTNYDFKLLPPPLQEFNNFNFKQIGIALSILPPPGPFVAAATADLNLRADFPQSTIQQLAQAKAIEARVAQINLDVERIVPQNQLQPVLNSIFTP